MVVDDRRGFADGVPGRVDPVRSWVATEPGALSSDIATGSCDGGRYGVGGFHVAGQHGKYLGVSDRSPSGGLCNEPLLGEAVDFVDEAPVEHGVGA